MTELYPIEREAIEAMAIGHPELAEAIRAQLGAVRVTERTNTGAGFYTDLQVEGPVPGIPGPSPIGEPTAEIDGLKCGLRFLLALRDGKMEYLECYSFEEVETPLAFDHLAFRMMPGGS